MKNYKVYSDGTKYAAVKQGKSWPGFFFNWIWAFTKGLYLHGGVALAVMILLTMSVPQPAFALLIVACVFCAKGNKWWETRLLSTGFKEVSTFQAPNPAAAVVLAQQNPSTTKTT